MPPARRQPAPNLTTPAPFGESLGRVGTGRDARRPSPRRPAAVASPKPSSPAAPGRRAWPSSAIWSGASSAAASRPSLPSDPRADRGTPGPGRRATAGHRRASRPGTEATATRVRAAPEARARRGRLAPISRQGLAAGDRAAGPALLDDVWSGRRDLIPPAEDERTRLIDRALVTHGFLTPEALAEIHRVGAGDGPRSAPPIASDPGPPALAGEAAVLADRAERARIKAAKKAEAAERRSAPGRGDRPPHATDIVYLGRGVSKFLGDRRIRPRRKLEAAGLPALSHAGRAGRGAGA